jgi:hypothetical protein
MNEKKKLTLEELYPLPEGVKLRIRKFGANPTTGFVSAPGGGQGAAAGPARPPFKLRWEDTTLGLTVLMREDLASGRLVADVFCTDPAKLNKASVSVSLVGKGKDQSVRKEIPLNEPETASQAISTSLAPSIGKTISLNEPDPRSGGCCGSAKFGSLNDAIGELGTELGLVVFMLLNEDPEN